MNSENSDTETVHSKVNESFYSLTPDQILDAIESIGLKPEAALLALNSYENRVYQFRDEEGIRDEEGTKFVAKFYRPGRWSNQQIIEEHRFIQDLAHAEIPVVAPISKTIEGQHRTLFFHQDFRFAIFPCCGGRQPDLDNEETLRWLGRFIGRIHAVGEAQLFEHRPAIDMTDYAINSQQFLLSKNFIPAHLFEAYKILTDQLIEHCRRIFDSVGHYQSLRLHGDCHPSNIMWTDDGPHFVDFDDSRNGPAVQDLWMLLVDKEDRHLLNTLLEGYEDFREFDDRELRFVEPLRCMRMMHYAAWLGRRWIDPSFKHNFPWFDSTRYWEEHLLSLKEQLAELQEL